MYQLEKINYYIWAVILLVVGIAICRLLIFTQYANECSESLNCFSGADKTHEPSDVKTVSDHWNTHTRTVWHMTHIF